MFWEMCPQVISSLYDHRMYLTKLDYTTKEKSKQNIKRDIEINNNLTIARVGGGYSGEKGFQELL